MQVSPSVVVVDIFDAKGKSIGLGSGTVIGAGQVITNYHVAQKGKSLQVRQAGKTFQATLRYSDPDRDLCQLSVPDLQSPPVVLGTATTLRVGQRVYAIGAPQGLELTLSEGLISSLRPYGGSQYIQTSAAISPGSSGGGLFDDQGSPIRVSNSFVLELYESDTCVWVREPQVYDKETEGYTFYPHPKEGARCFRIISSSTGPMNENLMVSPGAKRKQGA